MTQHSEAQESIGGSSGGGKEAPTVQEIQELQLTREMTFGVLGRADPLEEGTAIHSSILAWRIPPTEEPGRLQSMRSQES